MSSSLVIGNMVGSGIFLLPAALAAYGGISIFGWLFTATGAIFLALVFARLSRMMPDAGGPYAYTRYGLGDFAGFLVAWGYWISIWCGNAAISVAMVGNLAVFWPSLVSNSFLAIFVALSSIWFLTWINVYGVRQAGVIQLFTTILKLLPLIAIATLGFMYFNIDHFYPFNISGESTFSAITSTATLTLWALLGLESGTIPADNIKNPGSTIPKATIIGTLITAIVYILGTIAVMGVMDLKILASSTAPFADAAQKMWGPFAGKLVAAGAVISCFGALNGWILLQGQLPRAVARDGLFPAKFGKLSERGTPVTGLVVSSIFITLLMFMNYTKGLVEQFTFIILLATLSTLLPYIFSTIAELAIIIGRKKILSKRKLIRDSVIAIIAFIYSVWAMAGSGREVVYWGILLLAAGIPVYAWIKWRQSTKKD